MYTYRHNGAITVLTLYVNDLLIVGASTKVIRMVEGKLFAKIKMKDMGDVSLVLGMQVTRRRGNDTLTISQEEYTKSILDPLGMADCHAAISPGYGSEVSTKLPKEMILDEKISQRYQAITG